MTNPTSSVPSPQNFSLIHAIKQLPWNIFAVVLLIHLGVLWWWLGAYFGPTSAILPEPIFVTLEVYDPMPEESSIQSEADGPAKAYLYDTRPEGLR